MADIRGFRGFRYDLARVGPLSDLVAPPYDVIDPILQQKLYETSPYNAIRLELTRDEPGDGDSNNKYTRASRELKGWISNNVIHQDTARSLYIYEQEFVVDGKTFTRRGFFARVRLEPLGSGRIFPHEQTLTGPKADRLQLFQATGFNLSPIFGLYPDDDGSVFRVLEPFTRRSPPITATDHLGVVNRLWVVIDTHAISTVIGMMGPKPIFIADGHHRYETGLKYLEERKASGEVADDEAAPNFCLMMLVGMSDPGLQIQPTHRLVSGIPLLNSSELKELLADHFEIVGDFGSSIRDCWEHIAMDGAQDILGFGSVADQKWFAARLCDPDIMATLAPDKSAAWRELGVGILHKLVLDRLFTEEKSWRPQCAYVHTIAEVNDAMTMSKYQLAVLVPPVEMLQVEEIAGNRETMPPKSTYFYPKLLTGLVFNSLKKD